MILISNVKITNTPLYVAPNRVKLSSFERLDVWKYSLSTYKAVLPLISKVLLYVDLAEYSPRQAEIEEYIRYVFPEEKLVLRWKRNNTTADWRRASEKDIFPIGDNIIFNMMNDDHPFVDKDLSIISTLIQHLQNCDDPYAQVIYSHWPETIRLAANHGFKLLEDKSGFVGQGRSIQSLDIMKIDRWKHYWFDHDFGDDQRLFRPDEVLDRHGLLPNGNTRFVPIRELVRHFDGYQHAADFSNTAPPLEVPAGFFDNDIKIAYGYPENKPGYVNINPASPTLKAHDGKGADYKFALEDIPLAWKDRISEIDINPNCDLESLKKLRDEYMFSIAMAPITGVHVSHMPRPFPLELFAGQFISKNYNESN